MKGRKREETIFVDVTLWSRLADIAQHYLHKDSPAFIEGPAPVRYLVQSYIDFLVVRMRLLVSA
jgi:hypothetical protein